MIHIPSAFIRDFTDRFAFLGSQPEMATREFSGDLVHILTSADIEPHPRVDGDTVYVVGHYRFVISADSSIRIEAISDGERGDTITELFFSELASVLQAKTHPRFSSIDRTLGRLTEKPDHTRELCGWLDLEAGTAAIFLEDFAFIREAEVLAGDMRFTQWANGHWHNAWEDDEVQLTLSELYAQAGLDVALEALIDHLNLEDIEFFQLRPRNWDAMLTADAHPHDRYSEIHIVSGTATAVLQRAPLVNHPSSPWGFSAANISGTL